MIKIALITLMSVGAVGTGAQAINTQDSVPQAIELSAGSMRITAGADGVETTVAPTAEFSIAIRTKTGRAFTVRF